MPSIMDVMTNLWPAPTASAPVVARCEVPGSKSITNRALILAALADGPSTINGALVSRDTSLMAQALATMGVGVDIDGTTVNVTPGELHGGSVDCGLAGTVMRFVPPAAALASGDVLFDGDPQARQRPMGAILGALRGLGIAVDGDSLPFTVHGTGSPAGGRVDIDASGSSQFVSGLLLSAARFDDGITVNHVGATLPSAPHIEMTCQMLREAGVTVHSAGTSWTVEPGPISAKTWDIEPDLSNATPFLAAAAVTGGTVSVPRWPSETTQPGDAIRDILTEMDCTVTLADGTLTVQGPEQLTGIDLDMGDIGELAPTVTALAACATTPSRLTGIAHLRGHETDRLAALSAEFNTLGGRCEELPDGLAITPQKLTSGVWHSYADHRMATAGAILGLVYPGIEVENIETASKTLPGFAGMWEAMIGDARG